jgi:Putative prokaryotic signal transducing protein
MRYDAGTMGQSGWEDEKDRLARLYQTLSDEELAKIAADPSALTAAAKAALQPQLQSRGLPSLADLADQQAEQKEKEKALEPVLLRRYRDLPEATIAKSVLESAGIDCVLADDNLIRLDWFYSNLVGGIKLLVHRRDRQTAETLLEQSVPEKFDVEGLGEYEQPRCPRCKSMDVSFDGLNKPASYASLLIKVPIPIVDRGWKCHACGYMWEETGQSEPNANE